MPDNAGDDGVVFGVVAGESEESAFMFDVIDDCVDDVLDCAPTTEEGGDVRLADARNVRLDTVKPVFVVGAERVSKTFGGGRNVLVGWE